MNKKINVYKFAFLDIFFEDRQKKFESLQRKRPKKSSSNCHNVKSQVETNVVGSETLSNLFSLRR